MSDFGNSFKSARNVKNLTLEEIAQETRISARFLRAIEDETFDKLPGGVFNRGFIRTYAKRVGLDPEIAVAEYEALTADVEKLDSNLIETASKSNSDWNVIPIALGGLIILIVLFYVFSQEPTSTVDSDSGLNTSETASTLARPEPIGAPNPQTGALPPPFKPETSTNGLATKINDVVGRPTIARSEIGNRVDSTTSTLNSEIATPLDRNDRIHIQLQVHDTTWISVQSDSEETVEVELGPGTSHSFAAREAMDLTIGNAAGLTLFINGEQTFDLGEQGQVRILRITPTTWHYTGS